MMSAIPSFDLEYNIITRPILWSLFCSFQSLFSFSDVYFYYVEASIIRRDLGGKDMLTY
uniref:Uncharacterized protein n=1 Tax=Arundo donax TaxID=35708 RepID=A0A0A9DN46_ARUDO